MSDNTLAKASEGQTRVVIVGGGFGGLNAARELGNLTHGKVQITLLDRNNYHGFWPLLYQVATAGLETESVAYPIRAIVRKMKGVEYQRAEVTGVNWEAREVLTDGAAVPFDYLVLAAGSANNYFGNESLERETYGLKDVNDAERLRNHILGAFERAARETDPQKRRELMTIAVIGAGPTGVEMAGALTELIHHPLAKDFPMLDLKQARVVLIEAMGNILAPFAPGLQRKASSKLARMGVKVKLNAPVDKVEHNTVYFKDGTTLDTGTVIWTAGVRGAMLGDTLDIKLERGARVRVTPELHLPDRENVFVVGDMGYLENPKDNKPYPMVAPVAMQQGKHTAQNIAAQLEGKAMTPFKYFDKGQMATIGRRSAILDAFGIKMSGTFAWLGWLFIHLMYLVGFRNRMVVLANWIYNYITYDRGVRIIVGAEGKTSAADALPASHTAQTASST